MKKVKDLVFIMLVMLIVLTGCSSGADTKMYDTAILENATAITSDLGINEEKNNPFINGSRYFEVRKTSKYEFSIDVNGTQMRVQIPSDTQSSVYKPENVREISSNKYSQIFSESKELIYKYIESSSTLQDKEGIKEYIDEVAIKEATFTADDSVGAFFSDCDNTLYVNSNNLSYICEWMLVHEFIHAIAYYTHECNMNKEEYAYNIFNEVMTDIITASLNPKIDNSTQSGYSVYYPLVYPYINLVGQRSIEAYFYGYDVIYDKISRDEFEFFVLVIENYGAENTDVYYNNLLLKWYANY